MNKSEALRVHFCTSLPVSVLVLNDPEGSLLISCITVLSNNKGMEEGS